MSELGVDAHAALGLRVDEDELLHHVRCCARDLEDGIPTSTESVSLSLSLALSHARHSAAFPPPPLSSVSGRSSARRRIASSISSSEAVENAARTYGVGGASAGRNAAPGTSKTLASSAPTCRRF